MNAQATRLSGITKDLWMHWQDTRVYWRDAKSQEFEDQYLAELLNTVEKTVAVIGELDKLIGKIRRDCE